MELTLKHARQFRDLSQAKVADLLGVHRQTYMKWEKNPDEMPVGKAKEFAQITKVPIDHIFFITDSTFSRMRREDDQNVSCPS